MVRTIHVTGIASARTTAISLGAWIGRGRIGVLTAVRQVMDRSHALSLHALAAHSHLFSGHAVAVGSAAWNTNLALMVSNSLLFGSNATAMGAFPLPTGGINGVSGGTPTARAQMGHSLTAYVVDSMGRYVLETEHPVAGHSNLKPHGAAGPRIELGNVLRNTDILEITTLLQAERAGIF